MGRKAAAEIRVTPSWCKRCGICIAFCPGRVLEAGPGGLPRAANLDACTMCLLCELRCPDFAVEVVEKEVTADHARAASHAG
ncbi:MAG: 4Fe-4S dicluster domain-containing protein [Bacillota bacterium]